MVIPMHVYLVDCIYSDTMLNSVLCAITSKPKNDSAAAAAAAAAGWIERGMGGMGSPHGIQV